MAGTEDEMREMQDPSTWEFTPDEGAAKPRLRKPRAIVSVAFQRADFERVELYAEAHELKVSELIRQATLSYIDSASTNVMMRCVSAGSAGQLTAYFQQVPQSTGAANAVFEEKPSAA